MRLFSPDADLDALASEQVEAHAGYVPIAAMGTAAVAILVTVVFWGTAPGPSLAAWLGLLTVPFVWRAWLRRRWRRSGGRQTLALLQQFRATFALHGALWGLAGYLLLPTNDFPLQAMFAFIVGGLTSSSLTAAAFDLSAGLLFLFGAVAPLAVRMILDGAAAVAVGVMLTLYLGFMTVQAVRLHRHYVETFTLRSAAAARAQVMTTLQAAFGRLWQADPADTQAVIDAAARETALTLRLHRAVFCRFDHSAGEAVLLAAAGSGVPDGAGQSPRWPLEPLAPYELALASTTGLDRRAPLADEVWRLLAGTPLASTDGTDRVDVPLRVGGRVEGVFVCERLRQAWSEDEITFLTSVAATVLAAIEEARRRDAERALRELNVDLEQRIEARTRELRLSEARLGRALEATNDGVWDVDVASGTVQFSPVCARLLGVAVEALPTTEAGFFALIHPDDVAHTRLVIGDHVAGRRPDKDIELRLRTGSGDYRWFHDQGRIVERHADGTPRRMLGTISDITERRRMVDALHDSETRFRALFDKSPVIFILVDMREARIVEMNEVGLQAFGYERDEIIGRNAIELGLWVDDEARRRAARHIREQGAVSAIETELRRKSGETFWALLSGTELRLEGRPYALATLQDITARRELEARVLQSQKMEVVGHLAGGIAHDFNNVLTVIASMAELGIEDLYPGDPAHEALETIRQASTRASSLTRQLLAFSRRQVLQPAPVDLNDLLTAIEPIVRRAVSEKITVRRQPSATPATVHADRNSLEQVILNLAINARDAMPDGGLLELVVGTAVIEAEHRSPDDLAPGRYVTLAIRDTGVGMSEGTRRRVFEPFFTTKEAGKGTGLGLSVAHGIITQSGGRIEVESVLGAGTTFTIALPAAAQAADAPAAPRGAVATGRGRVLVVDDDADIRTVLGRALTFAGYEILAAGDGVEALSVLDSVPPPVDLLLTDVMMPSMGGQELAEHVRERYPTTRILFTSGYAENAIAHHGVLAEGVDFIAKPYSLQALTAKVREVMDRPVVN